MRDGSRWSVGGSDIHIREVAAEEIQAVWEIGWVVGSARPIMTKCHPPFVLPVSAK